MFIFFASLDTQDSMLAYYCVLFCSKVRVRNGIRFSIWLVSGLCTRVVLLAVVVSESEWDPTAAAYLSYQPQFNGMSCVLCCLFLTVVIALTNELRTISPVRGCFANWIAL